MLMMFPFEAPTIFEGIHKSYFRMPRVVKDQKAFKERPLEERQVKFITGCQEGHTEISFIQSGNQFILTFNPTLNPAISGEGCDFDKEMDKVHIKSPFILNGVCVVWRGYIDLRRLDGSGCLEFDECRAYIEDHASKALIDNKTSSISHLNHQYHQQSLHPPVSFNPMCNNNINMNNGNNNNAAAAALAAAAANSFHPESPLSRYVNSQQHTPPSQHNLGPPQPPQSQAQAPPTSQQQQQLHHMTTIANQQQESSPTRQQQSHQISNQLPPPPPPNSQMSQAAQHHLAAAMGAMGNPQAGGGPPMSLADSYGNAAIAAAAAAAFHQALSVSQQQHQQQQAAAAAAIHSGLGGGCPPVPGSIGCLSGLGGINPPGAEFLTEMTQRQRAS